MSKSAHISALARELLDDIELGRLSAEALVLKATRLARVGGHDEMRKWLGFETTGYVSGDADALKWMGGIGRWTIQAQKIGYWIPIGQVEAYLAALRQQLQAARVPDINYAPSSQNPNEWVTAGSSGATAAITTVLTQASALSNQIAQMSGIRSRVIGWIHTFAAKVFYESAFSSLTESIFEQHKASVDAMLAERASDAIEKIPAIYARLAEGDREAISHALTSCRRLIDAFADAVFPARQGTVDVGGAQLQVGNQHHKNRLNAYIAERSPSTSRRHRLRQTLDNLYERVSAGVHDDVTPEEARNLFLETYLLLGEIIGLGPVPQLSPPAPATETPVSGAPPSAGAS